MALNNYNGSGSITAYDNYYPIGSPSQSVIFGSGGTPADPAFGTGWIALGDPKMRVVNFEYSTTPVPERPGFAMAGGLAAQIRQVATKRTLHCI